MRNEDCILKFDALLMKDIVKRELSQMLKLDSRIKISASSSLQQEVEGVMAWLSDLQTLAVMTAHGWREVKVRSLISPLDVCMNKINGRKTVNFLAQV